MSLKPESRKGKKKRRPLSEFKRDLRTRSSADLGAMKWNRGGPDWGGYTKAEMNAIYAEIERRRKAHEAKAKKAPFYPSDFSENELRLIMGGRTPEVFSASTGRTPTTADQEKAMRELMKRGKLRKPNKIETFEDGHEYTLVSTKPILNYHKACERSQRVRVSGVYASRLMFVGGVYYVYRRKKI